MFHNQVRMKNFEEQKPTGDPWGRDSVDGGGSPLSSKAFTAKGSSGLPIHYPEGKGEGRPPGPSSPAFQSPGREKLSLQFKLVLAEAWGKGL